MAAYSKTSSPVVPCLVKCIPFLNVPGHVFFAFLLYFDFRRHSTSPLFWHISNDLTMCKFYWTLVKMLCLMSAKVSMKNDVCMLYLPDIIVQIIMQKEMCQHLNSVGTTTAITAKYTIEFLPKLNHNRALRLRRWHQLRLPASSILLFPKV